MSVGDVNSTERGSGARFNSGKPDLSLIPQAIIARGYMIDPFLTAEEDAMVNAWFELGRFQTTGKVSYLDNAIRLMGFAWHDAAHVFAYGKGKYAPWNWAKGMAWSIPIACAGRHALKVFEFDEKIDDESGHSHAGHFLCNLVMLRVFVDCFPEGDDLPDPKLFAVSAPTPVADPHFA